MPGKTHWEDTRASPQGPAGEGRVSQPRSWAVFSCGAVERVLRGVGQWGVAEGSLRKVGSPVSHRWPGVLTDDAVFVCVWQSGSSEDSAALVSSPSRSVAALMGPEEGRPPRTWMGKRTPFQPRYLSHARSCQTGGHTLHGDFGKCRPLPTLFPHRSLSTTGWLLKSS